MLKNVITHAEICSIYANISKFLHMRHNFVKMPLYAEKYAICRFWQNMRLHMQSHIRI